MNRRLYTYSLIRTLYDKGKDYIDSFWPLTVRVFPIDQSSLIDGEIQGRLQDRYGIYVPLHSVKIILTRAKRNGLLLQERGCYALTPAGVKYASTLEDERDVDRRINELLEDLCEFLSKARGAELSSETVRGLLELFVREHTEILGIFLSPEDYDAKRDDAWSSKVLKENEQDLLRYCEEAENRKPAIYATLRDMVCGSIISSTLGSQSLAETSKQFKQTTVFLDSNFMFSLLELHDPQFSIPSRELYDLIKAAGRFELRIFDFTVEEIVQVLKAYQSEHHMYVPHVKVNSIYSSMKSRGFSPADVLHLIARLEENIAQLGVVVHTTTIKLRDYEPRDTELRARLAKYKPSQGGRGQNHDLAAIEKVQELRRGQVRQLESAGAMFVTSDMRLARYDLFEHGHKDRMTIVEVVPDRLLTNVLWLKNPGAIRTLPLGAIIAAHSRQLFIDREVWGSFYRAVRDLKGKGSLNDEDISLLLYDQRLQDMLREVRREDAARVGEQLVLDVLPELRKRVLEAAYKVAREQEAQERAGVVEMIRTGFEEQMSGRDIERNQRIIEQIGETKERLRIKAQRLGDHAHIAIRVVTVCALIGVSLWAAPLVVQLWPQLEPLAWLAAVAFPLILAGVGIRYDPMGVSQKLRDRLVTFFYRKYLETADLDRLASDLTK